MKTYTQEKNKLNDIIDNALPVFNSKTISLPTSNMILDGNELKKHKIKFLSDSVQYTLDEVVNHKQHYPNNEESEVELSTEFFIVKRDDLIKLKEYLEDNE